MEMKGRLIPMMLTYPFYAAVLYALHANSSCLGWTVHAYGEPHRCSFCTDGSKALLPSCTDTEPKLFDACRTGKTQLCMTLCVTSQLPLSMGGAEGKAAVIDTEGSFRPERVVQIAQRFNLEPEAVLNNVRSLEPFCCNTIYGLGPAKLFAGCLQAWGTASVSPRNLPPGPKMIDLALKVFVLVLLADCCGSCTQL
jgi:hypothetical protein